MRRLTVLADELARCWDTGERVLAAELPSIPKPELSADIRARWARFSEYCRIKCVRELPAKPTTVATFLLDQIARGVDVQGALALLAAVEAAHDVVGLSNPVRTAIVRAVLDQIVKTDPPRSWPKEAKAEWALLPVDIRKTISDREQQRDADLRRRQNDLAAKVKQTEAKKELENGKTEIA